MTKQRHANIIWRTTFPDIAVLIHPAARLSVCPYPIDEEEDTVMHKIDIFQPAGAEKDTLPPENRMFSYISPFDTFFSPSFHAFAAEG